MKIYTCISRLMALAAIVAATVTGVSSCDSMIYDEEGDCDVIYRLRFRYDMNMKFADAFSHEVTSVRLYAFDSDGRLVWQTEESGERVGEPDYSVTLPLPAGDYSLMAWCGLDNGESFTVPAVHEGDPREKLSCRLNRTADSAGGAVSKEDLHRLYHGSIEVSLPADDDGGEYDYVMPLTKDTNVFRIVLQHLSGKDIDARDFTFMIEDRNGWLDHDNTLLDDEPIAYHAWDTYSGTAGVDISDPAGTDPDGTRAITEVSVAVAEITTSRLVTRDWSRFPKPVLVIRKAGDGGLVARIPVIDYALLVKGNYNRRMDDQQYLDRQDEYNMTFFLDDSNHWLATTVIINSWRVVINETDLH